MQVFKWLGLVAALHAAPSWSQESAHSAHQRQESVSSKSEAAALPASAPASGFKSAFSDYRSFMPNGALKDWRLANDEVREAGGQMGLMKGGTPAQPVSDEPHTGHVQTRTKP